MTKLTPKSNSGNYSKKILALAIVLKIAPEKKLILIDIQ